MWLDLILIWACQPHLTGSYCRTEPEPWRSSAPAPCRCSDLHLFCQFWFYCLERKCHESRLSRLSAFCFLKETNCQSFNGPLCAEGGRGPKISHAMFFWIQTPSPQITRPRGRGGGPMGRLAQQAALCRDAALDRHWKNQSGGTLHIVSGVVYTGASVGSWSLHSAVGPLKSRRRRWPDATRAQFTRWKNAAWPRPRYAFPGTLARLLGAVRDAGHSFLFQSANVAARHLSRLEPGGQST